MPSAENGHTVLARDFRSTLCHRLDVVNNEGTPAVSCQMREGALRLGAEYVLAEMPPGVGVVQRCHRLSLSEMVPTQTDSMTL